MKMKMRKWALLGMIGFGLAAANCGSSYSYQYTVNGCDTGQHSFGSLEAMCHGLQDNGLNNGCALSDRQSYFSSKGCSGTFQAF
jgi:hypothetical protein